MIQSTCKCKKKTVKNYHIYSECCKILSMHFFLKYLWRYLWRSEFDGVKVYTRRERWQSFSFFLLITLFPTQALQKKKKKKPDLLACLAIRRSNADVKTNWPPSHLSSPCSILIGGSVWAIDFLPQTKSQITLKLGTLLAIARQKNTKACEGIEHWYNLYQSSSLFYFSS